MISKQADQDNVIDGTVYCYDPVPHEGAYVTVGGVDGQVIIVALDIDDLRHLAHLYEYVASGAGTDLPQEDRLRITHAGLQWMKSEFGSEPS
ncbi:MULTISPECIES: hypothetical protein [Gordonia]|uniref:hypothetical protein n=1 Tax=Gordonia TaxID=2053 RepID=UPI002579C4E5|nr:MULTISPECIES: hypothetical protein [Gordonia]